MSGSQWERQRSLMFCIFDFGQCANQSTLRYVEPLSHVTKANENSGPFAHIVWMKVSKHPVSPLWSEMACHIWKPPVRFGCVCVASTHVFHILLARRRVQRATMSAYDTFDLWESKWRQCGNGKGGECHRAGGRAGGKEKKMRGTRGLNYLEGSQTAQ